MRRGNIHVGRRGRGKSFLYLTLCLEIGAGKKEDIKKESNETKLSPFFLILTFPERFAGITLTTKET